MIAFEKLLCPSAEATEETLHLFADVFGTPQGQQLIALLCTAQHPLCHTPGMTDHEHGRAEVIATIYRLGAQTAHIPATTTPTPPTQ